MITFKKLSSYSKCTGINGEPGATHGMVPGVIKNRDMVYLISSEQF